MDKIKIAICDDDVKYINILEKYIYKASENNVECNAYQSGENLLNAYKNNAKRYDVVFLDMEMKEIGGIETANLIRELDEHVIIVFVTSHTKYMQESFKCLPFRFLVKPVGYDEFKEVFGDIQKSYQRIKKHMCLHQTKKTTEFFVRI